MYLARIYKCYKQKYFSGQLNTKIQYFRSIEYIFQVVIALKKDCYSFMQFFCPWVSHSLDTNSKYMFLIWKEMSLTQYWFFFFCIIKFFDHWWTGRVFIARIYRASFPNTIILLFYYAVYTWIWLSVFQHPNQYLYLIW